LTKFPQTGVPGRGKKKYLENKSRLGKREKGTRSGKKGDVVFSKDLSHVQRKKKGDVHQRILR